MSLDAYEACSSKPWLYRAVALVCMLGGGCAGEMSSTVGGADADGDVGADVEADGGVDGGVDGENDGGACLPPQTLCQPTTGPELGTCCAGSTCVYGFYANAGYCFAACGPGGDCGPEACCFRIMSAGEIFICVPGNSGRCMTACDTTRCVGERMCQFGLCCGKTGAACSADFDCCLRADSGTARCSRGACD
jgi:hypothetical protein